MQSKKSKSKREKELDKESQSFKCLVCDAEAVRYNGEQWECGDCGFLYSGLILNSLVK